MAPLITHCLFMNVTAVPPCEATGPDGSRLVIRPHATTDSVADLARALDMPACLPVTIDGLPVRPDEPLVGSGLRVGSVIATSPPLADIDDPVPIGDASGQEVTGLEVAVVAGPACGRRIRLGEGRHTVGRGPTATLRVDDPSVELHHAIIDVGADGTATFTQLTGTCPALVDGSPLAGGHPIEPGQTIRLGTSRLVIGVRGSTATAAASGSLRAAPRDPWRDVVRRGPTRANDLPVAPIEFPDSATPHRAPPLTTLIGAGVAAGCAGLLAALIGQPLLAVFAAFGALASLATWAVGAFVARRDRRRSAARHDAARAEFVTSLRQARIVAERDHLARNATIGEALDLLHETPEGVWWRRAGVGEPLRATIGLGTCGWSPPIDPAVRDRLDAELLVAVQACEQLADVPVPLTLDASSVLAIHGARRIAEALVRAVLVQLATAYGPADWELVAVTDHPARWEWVRWLPHARRRGVVVPSRDDELARALAGGSTTPQRRLVILLDAPDQLTSRTGAVRRRLERGDAACIVVVPPDATVPAVAELILEVGDTGSARWSGDSRSSWSADRDIRIAGITAVAADAAARRLAPLIDPEDHDDSAGIPTALSLADLDPVVDEQDVAAAIADRWRGGGRDPAPIACLGMSADGIVDVDLVRDGPHGLIAGTTGSGKSELLRTLVASLAARVGPDHVSMILVDFKGGSTFDACARLPHTVGVVTDLDEGLSERMLVSLDAEVRRRERLLRDVGADDLAAYRRFVDVPLPRLVVVIDEFASLAQRLPEFLSALVAVAQRGRSLGIHLVLATQRPAGVVTDDIRANTNLRVALRLQDRGDAQDVVGDAAPAAFASGVPGRAALRLGPDDLVVFQTATTSTARRSRPARLWVERGDGCAGGEADDAASATVLEHLVDAVRDAAAIVGAAPPHRPWLEPLASVVTPAELGGDRAAVGLVDEPAAQCRGLLRWAPDDGTLLLIGAVGAGTTTAAVALVAACLRAAAPSEVHVYVIDAHGDAAWAPVAEVARCGGVVRVGERERLARLLARLSGEIERRSSTGVRTPAVVVVVDGVGSLRDALGSVEHHDEALRLDRVLRDGPAVGVVAVITTDGASAGALALMRSATWVFHVDDVTTARAAGLRAVAVPAGIPGRLRLAETGLEAQIVFDPDPFAGLDDAVGDGPPPIGTLPELVDPDWLNARCPPVPAARSGAPVELVLGLGADDLDPVALCIPDGDHVFIGGAARTGRSTALRQVVAEWIQAHPDGVVIRIDGAARRASPGELTAADVAAEVAAEVARCGESGTAVLVVADDAERIDDPDESLAALVSSHRPGVTVVVAARLDAVRASYGHWTRVVARSRCGLLMTSAGDLDGELLGATLPRRSMIPPRPGLAWVIDTRGHRLVQVAARMPG